jgi:hypothetical protein
MTRHPPRLGRVLRTLGTAAGVTLAIIGWWLSPPRRWVW